MLVLVVTACCVIASACADPITPEPEFPAPVPAKAAVPEFPAFYPAMVPEIIGSTDEEKVDFLMSKIEEQYSPINDDTDIGGEGEGEGRVKRQALSDPFLVRLYLLSVLRELRECRDTLNPTTAPPVTVSLDEGLPDPCTSFSTRNLTESWRKDSQGSNYKPDNGDYACDRDLQGNTIWFRFSGAGGTQLSNQCRPQYSCGGHGGFWSDAEMPNAVGEVRRVPIYGSWSGNCKWYTWPTSNALTVKRCSSRPGDFVYKVRGTSSCYWTLCGTEID